MDVCWGYTGVEGVRRKNGVRGKAGAPDTCKAVREYEDQKKRWYTNIAYPINKPFIYFKKRRAGSQQKSKPVTPGHSSAKPEMT